MEPVTRIVFHPPHINAQLVRMMPLTTRQRHSSTKAVRPGVTDPQTARHLEIPVEDLPNSVQMHIRPEILDPTS